VIKLFYGLGITLLIALIAYGTSTLLPLGAVALAIVMGMLAGNLFALPEQAMPGITFAQKNLLSIAIALMGINLDFGILSSLGLKSAVLIVIAMAMTLLAGLAIGKFFGLDKKLSLLLAIGNGVCGSSAIAAAAPTVGASKQSIGLSVAIVNFLGILGMFALPLLATLLGMKSIDAGILFGNTLQAVGQVTAAGFSIDQIAGISATTVKMGRVLLLGPLVFILILLLKNRAATEVKAPFPLFILFFMAFSLLGSFGIIEGALKESIATLSHLCLIVAMAGIGLGIHFNHIKAEGKNALLAASLLFTLQILFTLGFILYL